MFWSKRRTLRKAIKQEAALVEQLRQDCRDGKISAEECEKIEARWKEIAGLLNRIAPPDPLSLPQLMIRGTVVFALFFLMTSGVGFYIKHAYFPTPSVTYTSIEGDTTSYRYVPEERVKVSEFPSVQPVSTSDNKDIGRLEDVGGKVVEVLVDDERVSLYYTSETIDGGRALYERVFDKDLQNAATASESIVFDPGNILDASVLQEENGFLIAYGVPDISTVFLSHVDTGWQRTQESVAVRLTEVGETAEGLLLLQKPEQDGYYLLTTKMRDVNASVLELTSPVLRELDLEFLVVRTQALKSKQFTLDTNMGLSPLPDGGFVVFSNGRNPIEQTADKGDELYLFTYDKDWELARVVQLTYNGLPHDFHVGRLVPIPDTNTLLFPYQQYQYVPQTPQEHTGYSTDAGKVFVMALRDLSEAVGNIFVADYNVRTSESNPLIGGKNAHMALFGNRLYVAHDFLVEEDEFDEGENGDGAYRILRISWWSLSF